MESTSFLQMLTCCFLPGHEAGQCEFKNLHVPRLAPGSLRALSDLNQLCSAGAGMPKKGTTQRTNSPANKAKEATSAFSNLGLIGAAPRSAPGSMDSDNTSQSIFVQPKDADAAIETLIVMEYADMGTLDAHISRGHVRGDMVSLLF
jgi:hypothetical protein